MYHRRFFFDRFFCKHLSFQNYKVKLNFFLILFLVLTASTNLYAEERKLEFIQGTVALIQGENVLTKYNHHNTVDQVIVTPLKTFKLTKAEKKRLKIGSDNQTLATGDSVRLAIFSTGVQSKTSSIIPYHIAQIKKKPLRSSQVREQISASQEITTENVFAAIIVDFGNKKNNINDQRLKSQLQKIADTFKSKTDGKAAYTVKVYRVKAASAPAAGSNKDQRMNELTELSFNAFDQIGCSVTKYADFRKLQNQCGITTVGFFWPDGFFPYPEWSGVAMITGPVLWIRKHGANNYYTTVIQHELGHALAVQNPYDANLIADNTGMVSARTGGGHASLSNPNDIFELVDEYYDGEQDFLGNCWKRIPDEFNFPHLLYAFRVMPPERTTTYNVNSPGNSLTVTLTDIGTFPSSKNDGSVLYGVQIGGQSACGSPFLPMYTVSLKDGQVSLHTLGSLKNITKGRFWDHANSNTHLFSRFSSGTWYDTKGIFKNNGLKIEVLGKNRKGTTIQISNSAEPSADQPVVPTCVPSATQTPAGTSTPKATASAIATATKAPTTTPRPTLTPLPSPTASASKTPDDDDNDGDNGGGGKPGDKLPPKITPPPSSTKDKGDDGSGGGGGITNPGNGGGGVTNPGNGGGGGNPGNGGGNGGGGNGDPFWDDLPPPPQYAPSCTDEKTGTRTLDFYCCCAVYYNPKAKSGIPGGMIWEMNKNLSPSQKESHPGLCAKKFATCSKSHRDTINHRDVCDEWKAPAKCLDLVQAS